MIKAVIFDWAGTTIDYGCFAPIKGFIDGFASIGIHITNEMARKPMGLLKKDHARAISNMLPEPVSEEQLQKAYEVFETTIFETIKSHCDVKPHVSETIEKLRDMGIKIGSTTGYTKAMMDTVLVESKVNGYAPDFYVASDEVSAGRPKPFMIWANLTHFNIQDPRDAVKVGDTIADIEEGQAANCWTVGIIMGSSELGLTYEEVQAMPEEELRTRKAMVKTRYYMAGADYIIEEMDELTDVITEINHKLMLSRANKLMTPGPLTTKYSVKHAMLADHCTWDDEYKAITASVLQDITQIGADDDYATVLFQGSGSYAVEAMINSFCNEDEKILFLVNGEYGNRMVRIASSAGKTYDVLRFDQTKPIEINDVAERLSADNEIKSVIFVHCETTTGVLNPLEEIVSVAKKFGKLVLLDAMSSFASYEIDMPGLGIDALAASANKCLEGLPGLAFVIARKEIIEKSKGISKSHCLDIYDQYQGLYRGGGKFRFTSPTNILLALRQAIDEYHKEGGLIARKARYMQNHEILVRGLSELSIKSVVEAKDQSYIITTFELGDINFDEMYEYLKQKGFLIYPGKMTDLPTFRVGNIGDVYPDDMRVLLGAIESFLTDARNVVVP